MANSKKKAVAKPAPAKKSAAPALTKKAASPKAPAKTKPKAVAPAKKAVVKKAASPAKKPAAKKPAAAAKPAPKAAKASAKPTLKTAAKATVSKGSHLKLAKTAKPRPAKKKEPGNTATKPAARTASAPSAKAAPRPSNGGGSSSSVRKTALTATPLAAAKKLRPANGGASPAKAALRTPLARPIGFTLDEVRAIAKSNEAKTETAKPAASPAAKATKKSGAAPAAKAALPPPPAKPNHVTAASLADILGFNPSASGATGPVPREVALVPEKFKRYYKLLVELREHLTGQIDQHSEDTLKRSSKDDAGDLSSYGQHMADAGTDTFDRDFALSLVSSEQEALSEIEAAIKRITDGSYGVCEVSGQPIAKARLLAVPFTRYSAEAQKEIERNHYRVRTQAGLFGELGGEDSGKIMDADSD